MILHRITFGSLGAGLAVAVLVTSMAACSMFESAVGQTASDTTRNYAEYVFKGFKLIWVPALKAYRAQPECSDTQKMPCYKESIYKPLYVVSDAATACMVASTAPGVPLSELQECIDKVSEAKLAFTQAGLAPAIPVGATP